MSHVWVKDGTDAWVDHALDAELFQLSPGPGAPLSRVAREQLGRVPGAVLARGEGRHGLEEWMLLCAPAGRVRVNGTRVDTGARALNDRDAIALGAGHTVFFCLEALAQIVAFPAPGGDTCCIRCKLPLVAGSLAVQCPGRDCGFWHHQSAEQPCWTYAEGCANCGHPTAFETGFQWSPDEL